MNNKLHMDMRPKLVHKETGTSYPIATFEDLKDTMQLMERAAINIRPYLADWYEKVFLLAFQGLDGKPNEYENNADIPLKEKYVGLTTEQLATKTQEIMHVHKPSTDDIRKSYLYPLINLGLVDKAPSVKDYRHNIFYPVETGNITGSNKNKILVSDPNLLLTKQW